MLTKDPLDEPWDGIRPPDVGALNWVDVAFVIDSTGSMGAYIDEARRRARETAEKIAAEGDLNLRFALVAYRDHPPQDGTFVTRVHDFAAAGAFDAALTALDAQGGGDGPEAVWDGLVAAGNLQWRDGADKRCFLIGDAPPHGYGDFGDGWPKGCPCGLKASGIVELFHVNHIKLHALSIAGNKVTTLAFTEVADPTGGDCQEVDTPMAATTSYGATMSATASSVTSGSAYMAYATATAGAGLPVTVAGASASLGWTPEEVTASATYLASRGLDVPGTDAESTLTTPKKSKRRK